MAPSFASKLDTLGLWRGRLNNSLQELSHFLLNHDLMDPAARELLQSLRQRLGQDKMVLAFVGEFSRGKSELINAIFFADTGRRILPAAPGRTTMCPVELGFDPDESPALLLLDIETRLQPQSLAELRSHRSAWKPVPLEFHEPEQLAAALQRVKETRLVPLETARALGLWNDERPEDNPPMLVPGQVEVPAWRHAVINYPHPLLKRGLLVIDTPGLNAVGAEPELTLDLLSSAHGVVFMLSADTGVTQSDMSLWREHLGSEGLARFIALNKIDTLQDPLLEGSEVQAQIARQRSQAALTLGIAETRVFPLSARQALNARVTDDLTALANSRIEAFEHALSTELLPRRQDMLQRLVLEGLEQVERQVGRRLADRRRQLTEQLIELRGLRGKNDSAVALALRRVKAEAAEFEQCVTRVMALRAVLVRALQQVQLEFSGAALLPHVDLLHQQLQSALLHLGAKKAFGTMCSQLRGRLRAAQLRIDETREMLATSCLRLNSDFGFGLAVPAVPDLQQFSAEVELIERNYSRYLELPQALRLAQPRFVDQFRRLLFSKVREVFDAAAAELESWGTAVSSQIDAQLRERRSHFKRRYEKLDRIRQASTELEARIAEVESQDARLRQQQQRLATLLQLLRHQTHAFQGLAGCTPTGELETALPA